MVGQVDERSCLTENVRDPCPTYCQVITSGGWGGEVGASLSGREPGGRAANGHGAQPSNGHPNGHNSNAQRPCHPLLTAHLSGF